MGLLFLLHEIYNFLGPLRALSKNQAQELQKKPGPWPITSILVRGSLDKHKMRPIKEKARGLMPKGMYFQDVNRIFHDHYSMINYYSLST